MSRLPVEGQRLFLYLGKLEWADTWCNGGTIPVFPASHYLSLERRGIHTPDEVNQKSIFGRGEEARRAVNRLFSVDHGELSVRGIEIWDSTGRHHINHTIRNVKEDANILSFSRILDRELMKRLGGKEVVVEILDFHHMKHVLDDQMGSISEFGNCDYTSGIDRNHFLKSTEDEWQAEFRLVWKIPSIPKFEQAEIRQVSLPSRIARLITSNELDTSYFDPSLRFSSFEELASTQGSYSQQEPNNGDMILHVPEGSAIFNFGNDAIPYGVPASLLRNNSPALGPNRAERRKRNARIRRSESKAQ
jgi:hypothetical protein